jgi:predicted transcriptional regulator
MAVAEVTSVKLGSRKQQLQHLADTYKRSMHSLVLEAVDEYIEQREAQLAYEQRAIRAYEHFQETGLHVTVDELEAWADSLLTASPKDMPVCHK